MKRSSTISLVGGPVFLWIFGIVIIPCAALLLHSLIPPSGEVYSLENYEELLDSRVAWQAFMRSLTVSFWVMILTILAGYPIALTIARLGSRGRSVLMAIVIFPFLLSPVVRAYGWNVILSENGVVNDTLIALGLIDEPLKLLFNTFAIIIGETHVLLPYMILSLLTVIRRIDKNLEAAAMSLGAPPAVVFFRVVVPMTLPGLMTGMLLVFSLAMTAFATPFLLGGSRSPILTVLMYKYAFVLFDWTKAATVGGVLLIMGIAFVALHRWVSKRSLRDQEAI